MPRPLPKASQSQVLVLRFIFHESWDVPAGVFSPLAVWEAEVGQSIDLTTQRGGG